MFRKVRQGYHVALDGFVIASDISELESGTATGVYLNASRSHVSLHYTGLEGRYTRQFEAPADAAALRDLAKALNAAADDIERPRSYMNKRTTPPSLTVS